MSKNNKEVFALECGTKVKPFHYTQAKHSKNKFISSDGRSVTDIIYFNVNHDEVYCIAGILAGCLETWRGDGSFNNDYDTSVNDIFMVHKEKPKKDKKPKTKRWVNVYKINPCEGGGLEVSNSFESKKEAKGGVPDYAREDGSYIKTIKIKF